VNEGDVEVKRGGNGDQQKKRPKDIVWTLPVVTLNRVGRTHFLFGFYFVWRDADG